MEPRLTGWRQRPSWRTDLPQHRCGFRHTCGRDNTGALYCWGSNGAGQLGNNTNTLSNVPSKVFGQPPVLGLQLNQTLFHPGTPGLDGDAHARHRPRTGGCVRRHPAPGSTRLSLQPVGAVPGIAPFARLYPTSVQRNDLSYQFTGAEPPGLYTWFAALTQTGTLNVVGSIDQDSFTFSP